MTKQDKLKQAIELEQAIKQGKGEFVILKKLDALEDKIDTLKSEPAKDEEIEVELVIT